MINDQNFVSRQTAIRLQELLQNKSRDGVRFQAGVSNRPNHYVLVTEQLEGRFWKGTVQHWDSIDSEWVSFDDDVKVFDAQDPPGDLVIGERYFCMRVGSEVYTEKWLYATKLGGGSDSSILAVLTGKCYSDQTGGVGGAVCCTPDDCCVDGNQRFIVYSWVQVRDHGDINCEDDFCPVTYEELSAAGGPNCTPAYHIQNLDLPIYPDAATSPPCDSGMCLYTFSSSGGWVLTSAGCCGGTGACPSTPVDPPDDPLVGDTYSEDCPSGGNDVFVNPHSVVRLRKGTGDYYLIEQPAWQDLFRRTGESDADGEICFLRYFDPNTQTWKDGEEVRLIVEE